MKNLTISTLAAAILLAFVALVSADNGDVGAGDLVINEIMYNPSTSEPQTEWFEVYNNSGAEIDLDGCAFSEESGDTFTIAVGSNVRIVTDDYFVFGHTDNPSYTVDHIYGGGGFFQLNNNGVGHCDVITITCPDAGGTPVMIDSVAYDDSGDWPSDSPDDHSISFGVPNGSTGDHTSDNDNGSNWGKSTSIMDTGDYGTPGSKNDDVLGANAVMFTNFCARNRPSVLGVGLSAFLIFVLGMFFVLRRR